jgi:hypothetical protein
MMTRDPVVSAPELETTTPPPLATDTATNFLGPRQLLATDSGGWTKEPSPPMKGTIALADLNSRPPPVG